jgi:cysteinyl-tRNA synthetase
MSKSLGNIIPVREFLKTFSADAFRLFILQTHYRSPVDYSTEHVGNAAKAVERLKSYRADLEAAAGKSDGDGTSAATVSSELREAFISSMDDDFNTPRAVGALFDSVRKINALILAGKESAGSLKEALDVFDELARVLGLSLTVGELGDDVKALVEERNRFRAQKNWAEADRIRNLLLGKGIRIKDKSDGTTVAERV